MAVKLLGIDLDGTLLNSSGVISDGNIKAVKEAQENGMIVVPVTGRAFSALPKGITEVPGIDYVISGNGSLITRLRDMKAVRRYEIPREQTEYIVEYLDGIDCELEAYFGSVVYACLEDVMHYGKKFSYSRYTMDYILSTRKMVDSIKGLMLSRNDGAELLGAGFGDRTLRQEAFDHIEANGGLFLTEGIKDNIEVTHEKARKGAAFADFAEMLGIRKDETASFGDNFNDIDLLDHSGISICMGNGQEALKARCDMVTLSNDEDGVAFGIRKLLEV